MITNEQYLLRLEYFRSVLTAMGRDEIVQQRPMHTFGILATCPKGGAGSWEVTATVAISQNRDAATALLQGAFEMVERTTPGALAEAMRLWLRDHPEFLR